MFIGHIIFSIANEHSSLLFFPLDLQHPTHQPTRYLAQNSVHTISKITPHQNLFANSWSYSLTIDI